MRTTLQHRRRYGFAAAILAGFVAPVACLSKPPRPSFDDAMIASACAELGTAICDLRVTCSYMGFSRVLPFGDDPATCAQREALACVNDLHIVDTSKTPERTMTCAMSFGGLACSDFFDGNVPDRCIAAGPDGDGSPCTSNNQCKSGFCAVPAEQNCGTCRPQPVPGATCQSRPDCGHGLVCATIGSASTGTCVIPAADGKACQTDVTPCVATEVCVGENGSGTMGTCEPGVKMAGSACDPSRMFGPSCDPFSGLVCIGAGSSGACQPILFADPGSPCGMVGTGSARVVTDCRGGALCVKRTCVAPAADGGACDTAAGPPCVLPAVCVVSGQSTSGVCTVPDPAACF